MAKTLALGNQLSRQVDWSTNLSLCEGRNTAKMSSPVLARLQLGRGVVLLENPKLELPRKCSSQGLSGWQGAPGVVRAASSKADGLHTEHSSVIEVSPSRNAPMLWLTPGQGVRRGLGCRGASVLQKSQNSAKPKKGYETALCGSPLTGGSAVKLQAAEHRGSVFSPLLILMCTPLLFGLRLFVSREGSVETGTGQRANK